MSRDGSVTPYKRGSQVRNLLRPPPPPSGGLRANILSVSLSPLNAAVPSLASCRPGCDLRTAGPWRTAGRSAEAYGTARRSECAEHLPRHFGEGRFLLRKIVLVRGGLNRGRPVRRRRSPRIRRGGRGTGDRRGAAYSQRQKCEIPLKQVLSSVPRQAQQVSVPSLIPPRWTPS
jgi:hypothetical protein